MPDVPGTTERVAGILLDAGGSEFNVKHPKYGAVGGAVVDTVGIRLAIEDALSAGSGARVVCPADEYWITDDIDLPPGITLVAYGAVFKWVGGVAPTTGVITSNLTGQHGQIENLRILGLTVDCDEQPVGVVLRGLGPSCEIDVNVIGFTSKGIDIDRGSVSTPCEGFTLWSVMQGEAGSIPLEMSNTSKAMVFLSVEPTEGAGGALTAGLKLVENVSQCVFQKILLEDCNTPVDIGQGGGCVHNTFIGLDATNPRFAPSDITEGAYTGMVLFLVRSHATPNNFHSVIGVRDGSGFDRIIFDNQNGVIVNGGLGVGLPVVFGTSGSVSMASLALSSLTINGIPLDEHVQDMIAAFLLVSGALTKVYDDVANTLTIGNTNDLFRGARIHRITTDQTVASPGVWHQVQLQQESWDTNNEYDPATFRFTSARLGKVEVDISLLMGQMASSWARVAIYKNGALWSEHVTTSTSTEDWTASHRDVVSVNGSTDYLEVYVYFETTVAPILLGATKSWVNFVHLGL